MINRAFERIISVKPDNKASFLIFGLTLPNFSDMLALLGIIMPISTGLIAYIVASKLRDEQLANSINLLTLRIDTYISTKEDDIKQFKEDFKEVKDDMKEVRREIETLKIQVGLLPDRRNKDNEG